MDRATDQMIDIADAVVTAIGNASLTPTPAEVVRGYDLLYELEDMTEGEVYVGVAISEDEETDASRRRVGSETDIIVAVRSKLSATTNAAVDPLVKLCGAIRNLFRGNALAGVDDVWCRRTTRLAPYNPKHLREWRQFTGVVTLSFIKQ